MLKFEHNPSRPNYFVVLLISSWNCGESKSSQICLVNGKDMNIKTGVRNVAMCSRVSPSDGERRTYKMQFLALGFHMYTTVCWCNGR